MTVSIEYRKNIANLNWIRSNPENAFQEMQKIAFDN
jgi:hypothetical protein